MTLQPTIDYQAIREVKDLPCSWRSMHGVSLEVNRYVSSCRKLDPKRIEELVSGAPTAHLRETILENGLRYVTIHTGDGTQIFDENEYKEEIREGYVCGCGVSVHDTPVINMADAIGGADLGDGFKLESVRSSSDGRSAETISYVRKKVTVGDEEIEVYYSLNPPNASAGHLSFEYSVQKKGELSYRTSLGGNTKREKSKYVARETKVKIRSAGSKKNTSEGLLRCSVLVAYSLPGTYSEAFDNGAVDQVQFEFGIDGRLKRVSGFSQTSNPNPDISDKMVLLALRKGKDENFKYGRDYVGSRLLSTAIFGKDITSMQLDIKATLDELVEAAINGRKIEPKDLLFKTREVEEEEDLAEHNPKLALFRARRIVDISDDNEICKVPVELDPKVEKELAEARRAAEAGAISMVDICLHLANSHAERAGQYQCISAQVAEIQRRGYEEHRKIKHEEAVFVELAEARKWAEQGDALMMDIDLRAAEEHARRAGQDISAEVVEIRAGLKK